MKVNDIVIFLAIFVAGGMAAPMEYRGKELLQQSDPLSGGGGGGGALPLDQQQVSRSRTAKRLKAKRRQRAEDVKRAYEVLRSHEKVPSEATENLAIKQWADDVIRKTIARKEKEKAKKQAMRSSGRVKSEEGRAPEEAGEASSVLDLSDEDLLDSNSDDGDGSFEYDYYGKEHSKKQPQAWHQHGH
ncbi:hypothetical protein CBS101457_003433 [Exobasidium rhododendri]|nr:hypothetical protein CBS101457_003433 [Exobasidium rhododendri]